MRLVVLLLLAPMAYTAQEAPRPVVTEILAPAEGLTLSWVGTVAARREIDLGFLSTGTLAERSVDRGAIVAMGQVLARLDTKQLDASVSSAEAGVLIAQAQQQTASDAADRARQLNERGIESEATAQDAANALAAANAAVEQAHAALAQARDARDLAELKAPADGVVTEVPVEPGAAVSAGETVVRLATAQGREILIAMSEADAGAIPPGAAFDATLLSNPALTVRTVLRTIDPVAVSATRTRQGHLTLPPDASVAFRLGALTTVTRATSKADALTLPETALISGAQPPAVWLVDPSARTLRRAEIATGPAAGGRVTVARGLEQGDEVLVRGVNSVKDGEPVGRRIAPESLR